MSEQPQKSVAPIVLGIIAMALTVVNLACTVLCHAAINASADAISQAGDAMAEVDPASAQAVTEALGSYVVVSYFAIALLLVGSVTSFFSKGPKCKTTGIVTLACAILGAIMSIYPAFSITGLIAGILLIIAGALSIVNSKKDVAEAE